MVIPYSLAVFTCDFCRTRADWHTTCGVTYIPALYVQTSGHAAGVDVQVHGGGGEGQCYLSLLQCDTG